MYYIKVSYCRTGYLDWGSYLAQNSDAKTDDLYYYIIIGLGSIQILVKILIKLIMC